MSNANSPFGFAHLGFPEGGAVANYGLTWKKIAYNYGTALYRGDVLVDLGSGYAGRYTTGVAGSNVLGIVEGFEYLSTALGRRTPSTYLPVGDTAYDVDVCLLPIQNVPPQLFIVQTTSTPYAITDIGTLFEPYLSGTGTVIGGTGKSSMTLGVGQNTTATLPFKLVGFYSSYAPSGWNGTDDTSNYQIAVVSSNPFNAVGV